MIRVFAAAVLFLLPASTFAQHHQPYAGMQQRQVKALSDQQMSDLKAGRGMGLALPAELNGYPGPMHVLEHAIGLSLSGEQTNRTQALYSQMKSEAVPLGERLIELESRLDRLFASRAISAETLRITTEEIGVTQGRLREAHLKYHLAMMDVLTPAQVDRYRTLRGYGGSHSGGSHGGHR